MAQKTIGELAAIAGDFKPIPVGDYNAEVTGATFIQKSDKNPYFKVEFTIDEGPYMRRKQWDNITLGDSEGSAGYFFNKMAVLGLPAEYWESHAEEALQEVAPEVSAHLVGQLVKITVTLEEYPKGSEIFKNKVGKILPRDKSAASGPSTVPVTPTPQPSTAQSFTPPTLPAGL